MSLTRREFLAAPAALGAIHLVPGSLLAAVAAETPPLPDLSDWNGIRAQFALDPAYAHFASFFIASHPTPVQAAIDGYRRAIDSNPFHVVEQGLFEDDAHNLPLQVQTQIAGYLGARAQDVCLTGNTTTGLALVYHGLPLQPGDEVLCTTHDHYSHHESIRLATERAGATMRKIALFEDAASATTESIIAGSAQEYRPEDARDRPDVGTFQHRHPPADSRNCRRTARTQRHSAGTGRRWRARHRRRRRDHRHAGLRLLLRRHP